MFKLKFCCFLMFTATLLTVVATELVENGMSKATIVIPDHQLSSVELAAKEFQYHIKKASGATLPIINESKLSAEQKSTVLIYLGSCKQTATDGIEINNLKRNEAIISAKGNRVFIAGKDDAAGRIGEVSSGTLFAVYELLENDFGVRWLWPGPLGENIPENKNIEIKECERKVMLPLKFAHWRVPYSASNGWSSATAKNEFINAQEIWKLRHRFNIDLTLQFYPHSFTSYWERFSATNPDFFNLLPDGTRRSDPHYFNGRNDLISMCVSSPALHKQIVQDWLKTGMLKGMQINVNENDTPGKCTCDQCLSWDDALEPLETRKAKARAEFLKNNPEWYKSLGSVSNRYAKLCLAVLAEADRIAPEKCAELAGLIYSNYSDGPGIKLNPRIVERYCPPVMFPWTDAKVKCYKKNWSGWHDSGVRLIMRPNFTWDGHCFPIFYARKYADCFSFAIKRRMIAMDMDSLTGMYATQGPNLYMIARLQSNPDVSPDQVLNEFYGAFGSAAKYIREYFEYLEKVSDNVSAEFESNTVEGGDYANFYEIADKMYTPAVLAKCNTILAEAVKAAEGNETAIQRIKFLQIGVHNSELTINAQKSYNAYKSKGKAAETDFLEALRQLDKFRQDNEKTLFANIGVLRFFEDRRWPREMIRLGNRNMTELPLEWKFMWDPKKNGEVQQWQNRDLNDENWLKINVGQCWEKQTAGIDWQKKHNSQYDGEAWYRLSFASPKLSHGDRLNLLFGAVDEACVVWINGRKILDRPYPFEGNNNSWREAFEVDITDYITYDKPNQIAVKVIDKSGAGGIWKPVYLKVSPKIIPITDSILKNPGFEQGNSSWTNQSQFGKVQFLIDKENYHSGKCSAAIKLIEPDPIKKYAGRYRSWNRWIQSFNGLIADKKYLVQLWVCTSGNFDGAIEVWIRSGKKQGLSKANTNLSLPTTDGKWQMISMEFTPDMSDGVIYLNMLANRGSVNFDDVVICPLPEN